MFTGFVSANGLEAVKDILNQGLVFAADYTSEPVTEEPAEDGQEYVGVSAEEAAMYEAGLIPQLSRIGKNIHGRTIKRRPAGGYLYCGGRRYNG